MPQISEEQYWELLQKAPPEAPPEVERQREVPPRAKRQQPPTAKAAGERRAGKKETQGEIIAKERKLFGFGPGRERAARTIEAAAEPTKEVRRLGRRFVRGAEAIGLPLIKGIGKVLIRKGIRHPDSLINPDMKGLYLPSNPAMNLWPSDPMKLYFVRTKEVIPPGTAEVYAAALQGHPPDALEMVTGNTEQQIKRSLVYLNKKGLLPEGYLE